MPSAYQIFKTEIFKTVKETYFSDYKLKPGQQLQSLITDKCKKEWNNLSKIQKQIYINKSDAKNKEKEKAKPPPPYEQVNPELNEQEVVEKNMNLFANKVEIIKSVDIPNNKRRKIPKAVKESVWKKYISNTELNGKCFVGCGTEIQINNFEIGHVISVSKGGDNKIVNLRPVCSLCNKSMGSANLNTFIQKFGFKDNSNYDDEININNKQILTLNKSLTRNKNKLESQFEKNNNLKCELDQLNEQLNKLQIEIKIKTDELDKNYTYLTDIEDKIKFIISDKNKLDSINQAFIIKKEKLIKSRLIEEQNIKDEIKKEILKQQRKDELKLEVMKEMGIN